MKICISCGYELEEDQYECPSCETSNESELLDETFICTQLDDYWAVETAESLWD